MAVVGTNSITVGSSNGVVTVNMAAFGAWELATNVSWLHIMGAVTGTGPAQISVAYDASASAPRSGLLFIDEQTVVVTQAGGNVVPVSQLTTVATDPTAGGAAGVAVDWAGNVYFWNSQTGMVQQWNPVTQQTTPAIGSALALGTLSSMAIDGQGNFIFPIPLDPTYGRTIIRLMRVRWMPAASP